MTTPKYLNHAVLLLTGCLLYTPVNAALSLDRSRLVFNEGDKSVSVAGRNQNDRTPFLIQSWLEDVHGVKIKSPLMALPPLQRVEPGAKLLVRLQALPDISTLPADRESLFYFNMREIPPKSDKPNTLTLALQTRIKVFYRPASLKVEPDKSWTPGADKLTLSKHGEQVELVNPGAYHITIVSVQKGGQAVKGFEPVMVAPASRAPLGVSAKQLGDKPALLFINDYGGIQQMALSCQATECRVDTISAAPVLKSNQGSAGSQALSEARTDEKKETAQ